MSKWKCKGTVLQQSIASVYTAVAQVIEMDHNDIGDETFDSTCLDTSTYKTKATTGYAEPGKVSFTIFYDPVLAGHIAITGRIAQGDTNWKFIFTDGSSSVDAFTSAGMKIGIAVKMNDGLKMNVDLECSGTVTLPS